ncbi:MAG: hypothetical protein A2857_01830 [Candidatus Levybacteria bacterium RIFCSPHIGHO2_01_FULL_36_15]|nr:MAG: hypothetical protein A2857_01830 [Candidatus Levybacteria bacterium RIFCSPHIGHO2_01_FULL_36_15]
MNYQRIKNKKMLFFKFNLKLILQLIVFDIFRLKKWVFPQFLFFPFYQYHRCFAKLFLSIKKD